MSPLMPLGAHHPASFAQGSSSITNFRNEFNEMPTSLAHVGGSPSEARRVFEPGD
jgi:hypothetical protein